MITWDNFKNYNTDKTTAFENLCRLIFKKKYLKDISLHLNSGPNNPGIEAEPIKIDGVYVGFQAKFFESKTNYPDFKDSIEKAHKFYSYLNKIVIFCNNSISTDTKSYINNIKNPADEYKFEIELFTNDDIIDYINTKCSEIIPLFFNNKFLTQEKIRMNNQQKLDLVKNKYFKENHIKIDLEDKINDFSMCEQSIRLINESIQNMVYRLENFPFYDDLYFEDELIEYNKIKNTMNDIVETLKSAVLNVPSNYEKLNSKLQQLSSTFFKSYSKLGFMVLKNDEKINDAKKKNDRYLDKNKLGSIIDSIDSFTHKLQIFEKKIMIIEGAAGVGKTHLLSRIVENNMNDKNFILFFIGNKIISSANPSKSLISNLNLSDISFIDFLDAYESYCASAGLRMTILFDAVNEVYNNRDWKIYLCDLLYKIEKYEYIKIVLTIRTTYTNYIFDESIIEKIKNGEYIKYTNNGFLNNQKAISAFMKFYNLKYNHFDYNIWLSNPLYLKIYCEVNKGKENNKIENPFEVFMKFVENEENKIREQLKLNNNIISSKKIVKSLAKYMFENNLYRIKSDDFHNLFKDNNDDSLVAKEFVKNEVLLAFILNDDEYIEFCYQKIYDYAIANYIESISKSFKDVLYNVKKFLKIVDGKLINSYSLGICVIMFARIRELYEEELIVHLLSDKYNNIQKDLYLAYVESLSIYPKIVNLNVNYRIMFSYDGEMFERIFKVILSELKSSKCFDFHLHKFLINKEMHIIDKIWTININNCYLESEFLKEYLNDIKKEGICNNKIANLTFISWLLSSSCRELRDTSTKILTINLINDYNSMLVLMKKFINVKDIYVKERLFAAIYGAVLNSNVTNADIVTQISRFIIKHIFGKPNQNVHILLRDYCCNLLSHLSKKYNIKINMNKIIPPYRTKHRIKKVSMKKINQLYGLLDKSKYGTGLYSIFTSMYPNYNIDDNGRHMYGDFGRYTFQSSLSNFGTKTKEQVFTNLNEQISTIFKYAYYVIVKKYKYSNKLFSEYDNYVKKQYYGRNTHSLERIGKKYQWIVMHYILALISDKYDYEEIYSDFSSLSYEGTWRPYVRDIDPSLLLVCSNRLYKTNLNLYENEYNNWNIEDKEWAQNKLDSFIFDKYVELNDLSSNKWNCLFRSKTYNSTTSYDVERQSFWTELSCCILKKEDLIEFVNQVKDISFYGRWAHPTEGRSSYTVFIKEYFNSRAYSSEFYNMDFESLNPISGYEMKMVKMPQYSNGKFVMVEKEQNVPVRFDTVKIKATHLTYQWEKTFDFSISDGIRVTLPIQEIVEYFDLKMKKTGQWFDNDILVCSDLAYIYDSNVDGLYIRKDYFNKFLDDNNLTTVWVCLGEKIHSNSSENYGFNELSSLMYYDENGNLISINHSNYDK